jgi:hypothetical protein
MTTTDIPLPAITLACRARPSVDVLLQEVGGESVLFDLAHETYFGLDPLGTHIWRLLDQGKGLSEISDAIVADYEVQRARAETDLIALVSQLAHAGLVAIE